MTTIVFISALFCQVDDHLVGIPKHPDAHLSPSEVVTLALLHALKGVGNRAFSRWLTRDYRTLFPQLPERTRSFVSSRLIRTGRRLSWPLRRCSASSIPMGSSSSILSAKAAA